MNFLCLRDYRTTKPVDIILALFSKPSPANSLFNLFNMSADPSIENSIEGLPATTSQALKEILAQVTAKYLADAAKAHKVASTKAKNAANEAKDTARNLAEANAAASLLGIAPVETSNTDVSAPDVRRPPQNGNSAWVNHQPTASAASAATVAAPAEVAVRPMSATTVTDVDQHVDQHVDPNAGLFRDYRNSFKEMQVPMFKVASAAGIVTITFSLGYLPVDAGKMWKRMGICPIAKPSAKGFIYTVTMTAATASKYGKTLAEIEAAFLAHLALDFSRKAKNGNTQTYSVTEEFMAHHAPNLELTDEEKKFCTDEGRMLNTYRFIQEYLAKRSGAVPQHDNRPKVYNNHSKDSGSGGGAALTTVNNIRSNKARGSGESGDEFTPTGELAAKIDACRPQIPGAQPKNPAKYKHMSEVLTKNKLGYNRTSGSFSSSDPAVTKEMIEKIICAVFDLRTTAELADMKRAAAAAKYKAQQAANAAVSLIARIPDGAESDTDNESDTDAESDTDKAAKQAAEEAAKQTAGGGSKEEVKILNDPDREGEHMVDGTVVIGFRQDFTDGAKHMIATAAKIDEPGMEKIVDAIGAEYGVYVNGKGVYSLKPDDVHSDERTRKIAKEILAAIAELADQ